MRTLMILILHLLINKNEAGLDELKLFAESLDAFERSLSFTAIIIGMSQGYGCWCYWDNDILIKGPRGTPVDQHDQLCFNLNKGYSCITRDGIDEDDPCPAPWFAPYNVPFINNNTDVVAACNAANPSGTTCGLRTCLVEGAWTKDMAILSGQNIFPQLLTTAHIHGNFDVDAICIVKGISGPRLENSEVSCCGDYPTRNTYSLRDNTRDCCGNKVYGIFHLECCDEDTSLVKTIGSC